jgi:steroid delta-isomerase-like uncharacterized protein
MTSTFFKEDVMPQATAVSPQALIDAAKAPIEAFGRQNWDEVRSSLAPNFVYEEVATGRKTQGPEESIFLMQGWAQAFPDCKATFHDAFASGTSVLLEVTWKGTHQGLLQTPAGTIKPTGKSIEIRACLVNDMSGEKLRSQRHYFDMATMYQQLGLLT